MATLSVSANGSQPLSYQWQFNSNSIPGAVTDSLLLTNIALADFGAYRVVVSNPFGSVTSGNALLQLDADGDGLADSWEIAYFGNIASQSGAFDRDNDGVSNLAEFREDTNPTDATSLFPRLTVQAYRCSVAIIPFFEKYTKGQVVVLTAIPNAGQSFIQWTGATNSSSTVVSVIMTGNLSVTAQAGLSLADSLDITNRVSTGGEQESGSGWSDPKDSAAAAWFGQSADTKDGIDAARSGRIGHNQTSWLQITNVMSAEGTVSFWWKVDSEKSSDYLIFSLNDRYRLGQTSGFTNWHQKTYYLTSGVQRVRWDYFKDPRDGSDGDGTYLVSQGSTNAIASNAYTGRYPSDAGWLDQLVFEVYDDPLRDTDGDGLADLWEYRFFYSLDQIAANDPDNDGISNLDEFLEGTDPASNSSLKPRLTLLSEGAGTVSALPSKPKYDYGENVTLSAVPDVNNFFVMWTGDILDTNANTQPNIDRNRTIKGVFGFALNQALESYSLTWTRGGAAGWYGQAKVSHDGVDAARSAPIDFGHESWMETTITGPGQLSFWWKALSLAGLNTLRLDLNGVEQAHQISGDVDWEEQIYFFGPGTHTVRWRFVRKNYEPNSGDAGWVDQVTFIRGDIAPIIRSPILDRTGFQGSDITLSASAVGTPTLLYEWLRNGISISPASTNSSLTLTNVALAQSGGGYALRVSNAGGAATSAPFTITLLPFSPVNDDFAARLSLPGPTNTVSGYNFGATKESGEPDHANFPGGRSVWYSWTAPQKAKYRIVAEDPKATSALLLGIYSGNSVDGLTEVGSESDFGTFTDGANLARAAVLFNATAGATYAIAVDTSFGPGTSFTLATQLEALIATLANDAFANRIFITNSSVTVFGTNLDATREPGEPSTGFLTGSNSVWWAWTAPRSGTATVTWTGSSFTPFVSIFTGNALPSLTLVTNNPFGGGTSLRFPAAQGVTYDISIDSLFESGGDIVLNLAMIGAPANDAFANRTLITGSSITVLGNNLDATREPGEPGTGFLVGSNSVWWTWIAPSSGPVEVTVAYTGFFPLLSVYTGSALNSLSLVAQGMLDPQLASTAKFSATAGTVYQILVDGLAGQGGPIEMGIVLKAPVLGSSGFNSNRQFSFSFTAPPNASYVIEASTNLVNWFTVFTGTVPPDGTIIYVEPPAQPGGMRFYRVRML